MQKLSVSVKQTLALGKNLARELSGGEIILLSGPLGAGKTVFAKGLAQGLGINKNEIISPTFILLRIHEAKLPLQHFDLYRIKGPRDIFALGYEEYFYPSAAARGKYLPVTVVEWPQRLESLLPAQFLKVEFVLKDKNKRLLKFSAKGARYKKLLEGIFKKGIISQRGF